MSTTDRREFLKRSAQGTAAAAAVLAWAEAADAKNANDRLKVGVIGPGGMGSNHVKLLAQNKNIDLAYLCDVDEGRLAEAIKLAENGGRVPEDLRRG